ncbi:YbaN family protein [Aquibacillus saliphilus]|uniref:YbaN family protein n=1 Tax=Aquibacillus saliphilus TaxID=1909422 RepID=UPI001CEFCFE4|nr:YbaN family protein [Aquibacillus saliphilus]
MNKLSKPLLIFFGTLCLSLGVIGVILPLLPTTPLLLLAAYCYGKSSKKLNHWLKTNKFLGKYITQFQQGHGVTKKTKVKVLVILWISALYSILFVVNSLVISIVLLLIFLSVSYYILSLKVIPPEEVKKS